MLKLSGFGLSGGATAMLRALALPLMGWLVAPAVLAEFVLWQLILSMLTLFAGLGLNHALTREFDSLQPQEQPLLLIHCLISTLFGAAIVALLFVILTLYCTITDISYPGISNLNLVQSHSVWFIGLLLICSMILQLIFGLGGLYLRAKLWANAYAKVQVGSALLWLITVTLALLSDAGPLTISQIALLWLTVQLLSTLYMLYILKNELIAAWALKSDWFNNCWRRQLQAMLAYGSPLLLSELLYWGMGALGAVLLTFWHGLESMALYAMAVAMGSAGSLLGQIFTTLWLPEVYRAHQQDKSLLWVSGAMQQILWYGLGLTVLATAGGFIFVQFLPDHYEPVSWLIAAAFLKPLLMSFQRVTAIGIELQRATWVSPLLMFIALCFQLLFSYWLIPSYASAGAIVSALVAAWLFWQMKSIASAVLWRNLGTWRVYLLAFIAVFVSTVIALI